MRAVLPLNAARHAADAAAPRLGELPEPVAGPGEVLIAVEAAGINHADLLQLRGLYPPPPGESEVPGLECAGRVLAVGEGVASWRPGDRVMALLAGGGHATRVAAPAGQVMALPDGLSFIEGGALPEACLTAWTNLVAEGGLQPGETVLVTGATGGMGTMFVQLARELGARVLAAARDRARLERLRELGIDELLPLGEDLPARVREATGGQGVELAIDLVGGPLLPWHLDCLRAKGRLVLVGLTAGPRAELDLRQLMGRRQRLIGSVLRARSRGEKAKLVGDFAAFARPRLADGRIRPVVDLVFPLEQAAEAYAALRQGGVFGKVVLRMDAAGYIHSR